MTQSPFVNKHEIFSVLKREFWARVKSWGGRWNPNKTSRAHFFMHHPDVWQMAGVGVGVNAVQILLRKIFRHVQFISFPHDGKKDSYLDFKLLLAVILSESARPAPKSVRPSIVFSCRDVDVLKNVMCPFIVATANCSPSERKATNMPESDKS